MKPTIVLVWENFGPMHHDRCVAVARGIPEARVVGLELSSVSSTYSWAQELSSDFEKITLTRDRPFPAMALAKRTALLIGRCLSFRRGATFFFCHYNEPAVFLTSALLRMLGFRCFTMNDSKFDDYERQLPRELFKSFLMAHYNGAVSASVRSAAYFRFLGFVKRPVLPGYDTFSVARIRGLVVDSQFEEIDYSARHFVVVARLIPKKNIAHVLAAFAEYAFRTPNPRKLEICGAGPLRLDLEERSKALNISHLVDFNGHMDTSAVANCVYRSVATVLMSTEEQFGFAITESIALGIPVIVSRNCGAVDHVKHGYNGYILDPDNVDSLADAMGYLGGDEDRWLDMSRACSEYLTDIDAHRFAESVQKLAEH